MSQRVNESALSDPQLAASDTMRVCVGFATRGRPGVLAAVVDQLQYQTLTPAAIVVACVTPGDVGELSSRPNVTVLVGPAGSCRQRNAILRHRPEDFDVIVFFDDDFVPHPAWISSACSFFAANPDVGAVTGEVIADGIKGPGISFEEARSIVAAAAAGDVGAMTESYSPYGCNMAFRSTAVRTIRFDERLVLYGWLEDLDFGGALAREGWRSVKIGAARGVHMGIKQGRMSGRKLGYSQVMNPFYIRSKGGLDRAGMARHIGRNLAANLLRSVAPEPYIDRRGRVLGNLLAIADLCRGRVTPERAERL